MLTSVDWQIRQASTEDVELIEKLGKEVFSITYREMLSAEQLAYMIEMMYAPEVVMREIESGVAWFIAEYEGKPCGYISVEREEEQRFHLHKIYLHPTFHGHGFGEKLFQHAVNYIRSVCSKPCMMELNVNRDNSRALAFYERMGMRCLLKEDFPIGNGFYKTDYIMGLDIETR